MSHWNYRVVRSKLEGHPSEGEAEFEYTIHEVYYNDKDQILSITENSVEPWGESVEDIKISLQRMLRACEKDVLVEEEIQYASWDEDNDDEDEAV